jgi:hypothetical protein
MRHAAMLGTMLTVAAAAPAVADMMEQHVAWGSSMRPFAADSPWNSHPIKPMFGTQRIPPSKYSPAILSNGWSTAVFVSSQNDPPMSVGGAPGTEGVWNPDERTSGVVHIPHWPANVEPAAQSDGHADIVDPTTGIIHSFWKLRKENGRWIARQYAWSNVKGRGWGDPAHSFQGARATGVPTMAGLIRRHEVDDGAPLYRHALAMSLAGNGLAPGYVFPATSADTDSATNTGSIPEGALLMLPPSFDSASLSDAHVRKIAETLKVYGAYVVDRNEGTPFVVYAEIGSGLDLHKRFWNRAAVEDMERIRSELRPVIGAEYWLDGNGKRHAMERNLNLVSMRGPWKVSEGEEAGHFESWTQSLVFPDSPKKIVQKAVLPTGLTEVTWAQPRPGVDYCLRNEASGGASLRLILMQAERGTTLADSGDLPAGGLFRFTWPVSPPQAVLIASSGKGSASRTRAILRACEGGKG